MRRQCGGYQQSHLAEKTNCCRVNCFSLSYNRPRKETGKNDLSTHVCCKLTPLVKGYVAVPYKTFRLSLLLGLNIAVTSKEVSSTFSSNCDRLHINFLVLFARNKGLRLCCLLLKFGSISCCRIDLLNQTCVRLKIQLRLRCNFLGLS